MSETPNQSREAFVHDALEQFEGRLGLYARSILRDRDRALDCVQDTFLRLWRQDPEDLRGHLSEWLFAVCRNRALDLLRKEKSMTPHVSTEALALTASPGPGPEELAGSKDQSAKVRGAIEALPGPEREVLQLKFQQGLSYREIAGVTGHSVSNVGFLIHTGLKSLRGRLRVNATSPLTGERGQS